MNEKNRIAWKNGASLAKIGQMTETKFWKRT